MPTSIIIQARTGSTRLPNKMLMPFYENQGILQILIERIKKALPEASNNLIVGTTTSKGDDRIQDLCKKLCIKCYRGSEDDVLSRFIEAAETYKADKIVRVCADNVFLDMHTLENLLIRLEESKADYVSYCMSDGTPSIKTHYGFWAEGTKLDTLKRINEATTDSLYHEHVTNYIYTHPAEFTIDLQNIEYTIPGIESHKNLRLTIDTVEDFNISQEIYGYMIKNGIPETSKNVIKYIESRPEFFDRMKEIIKKNAK